jgi:hypothetical protein
MQDAARNLTLAFASLALAACAKQPQQPAENRDVGAEANLANGELPPNAEIETLPPDESSETSSGELNSGDDNPDVNDLGNSH